MCIYEVYLAKTSEKAKKLCLIVSVNIKGAQSDFFQLLEILVSKERSYFSHNPW